MTRRPRPPRDLGASCPNCGSLPNNRPAAVMVRYAKSLRPDETVADHFCQRCGTLYEIPAKAYPFLGRKSA